MHYEHVATLNTTLQQDLELTAFNRDEKFAAKYLGLAIQTLRGYRQRGIGPEYRRIGGRLVKYSVASLRSWAESQPRGGRAA